MKKLIIGTIFLTIVVIAPLQSMARVDVSVNIGLPPPIAFVQPPEVIVLPNTDSVYAVPGLDIDLFFWNGWWWRPWQGHWYRSRFYDRGWAFYSGIPVFYTYVDPGWRVYYNDHNWRGSYWSYRRIPHHDLQSNWRRWHNDRYWERRHNWDVRSYTPPRPPHRRDIAPHRQFQHRPEPPRPQHHTHDGPHR
ncbi:MAG TPA: hypothetical protein VHO84_11600 [Syntrophorhabdaceae bacterium]|nr:hypothetical protein [Syntrophorhabdaceae bacterium]